MTKYFKKSEFSCKCCGKNNVSPELMEKLDKAREIAGIPFVVNSGCRCAMANKEAGGVSDSPHLGGYAADIKAQASRDRFLILMGLIDAGFNRIGIGRLFIHADIDPDKDKDVTWVYRS